MGKDVAKGAGKAGKAIKGTGSKLAASAAKAFKAFPRLGLAAKLVPGLGAALAAGQGIAILMDDSMSKDDKIKAFGGLLGGTLGSAGFAALGAALGTAVFPGVGTIGGGLLGGVLGYFGGDYAGRKAASFLLGEQTEEEKIAKNLDAAGGGVSNDAQATAISGGGGFSDDAQAIVTSGSGGNQGAGNEISGKTKFKTTGQGSSKLAKLKGVDGQSNVASQVDDISPTRQASGMGNTTIINNNTTNAPVNNNSTTSTVNSIVESDPMFNRNSRYAI